MSSTQLEKRQLNPRCIVVTITCLIVLGCDFQTPKSSDIVGTTVSTANSPAVELAAVGNLDSNSEDVRSTQYENAQATPEDQQLRVYRRDDNQVFWPIDLPFWIRLTPSPADGAESYLLTKSAISSVSTDEDVGDGVRLEIPGNQFIRWINAVTHEETRYRFIADGGPPEVKIVLSGANSHQSANTQYFGLGLQVTVEATDAHSGVKSKYLAINGGNFIPITNNLQQLDQERMYHLKAYAIDQVGYVSEPIEKTFQVDLSPPSTEVSVADHNIGKVLSPQATIHLSSEDELSGVQSISWAFNADKRFRIYNANEGIKVFDLDEGSHILRFFATDHVGNREPTKSFEFYLDRSGPVVAHTFIGDLSIPVALNSHFPNEAVVRH